MSNKKPVSGRWQLIIFNKTFFFMGLCVGKNWVAHFTLSAPLVSFAAQCSLFGLSESVYSLVSVCEQTGPALIVQANRHRIYYYCYYYYRGVGAGQGDHSCWVGRSVQFFGIETGYYCPARVITASLQANARKFGQRGCCLKCFTVWLSHAHYVSYSVSSCFHRVCFVHTGAFLQCDRAFK